MVNSRLFCVIGLSFTDRYYAIEKIKAIILKGKNQALNATTLYSRELSLQKFKDAVCSFCFDGEKVIILKDASYLLSSVKGFFLEELKAIMSSNHVIFEIDKHYSDFTREKSVQSDTFFQTILRQSVLRKIHSFKDEISLGSFIYAIRKSNVDAALYCLERLFLVYKQETDVGLHILGVLVREFSSLGNRTNRQKYLKLIWETDRLIKARGIKPKVALGVLVAKLLRSEKILGS